MGGATPAVPGRIFISYRRQETAYPAGWLYERVAAHFGREQVFKDVDSIKLGDDFAEVIANAVGSCDALLALIGDRWLTVTDEDGRRRLDDPDDFVRLEIETALERNIRVIPVLFEGARLPRATDLPSSLAKLVRRQALELSPSRFDADIGKLLRVLDSTLADEQARRDEAAKAAREAEEQTRRDAQATAAREAEEQARRESEERKLSAMKKMANHLRSGDPATVASAEGALRQLTEDANQRMAQAATHLLTDWEADKQSQRKAEDQPARRNAEQAAREAEERKLSTIAVVAQELRSGSASAVASAEGALRRLANDANKQVAQTAASVLADEKARHEAAAAQQAEAQARAEQEAYEKQQLSLPGARIPPPRSRIQELRPTSGTRRVWQYKRAATLILAVILGGTVVIVLLLTRGPPGTITTGSSVTSVAVTPNGKSIISGSAAGTVTVWDLATGKRQRTLTGHRGRVSSVAVTPDGKRIVSDSDDNTLRVWDLATGRLQRTITADSVTSVAITPNGKRIIGGSHDHTIKMWDLATGKRQRTLTGHTGAVSTVAVTHNGKKIISGSEDNTVRVWDLATGRLQHTLTGHTFTVFSVAVTPNDKRIVSGSGDHKIGVWDLATSKLRFFITGHTNLVNSVAVTPDGKRIVSGSSDHKMGVWDLATGRLQRTLTGHADSVTSVAITPDGRRIISGSNDHTIKVWDLASGNS